MTIAEATELSFIDEAAFERTCQITDPLKVRVQAISFTGQYNMQGVVKVVIPDCINAKPAHSFGKEETRVVEIGLGDQEQWLG